MYTFPGCETGTIFSQNTCCNTSLTATLPDLNIAPVAFNYSYLNNREKMGWVAAVRYTPTYSQVNWQPPSFDAQNRGYKFSAVGIL